MKASVEAPAVERPPSALKRLYRWVLDWADTKYGLAALMAISFAESSFFIIPPDVLLMALCMGAPKRSFVFAFWCSLFSVLGGAFGYLIGAFFYDEIGQAIIAALGYQDHFAHVADLYGQNAFLAILAAAFTPIPYKVFTLAAGVFHEQVSLTTLLLASALGRSARFFMVGGALYFFGPPVKVWLDKYLEVVTVAFLLLLVGGFLAMKFLF